MGTYTNLPVLIKLSKNICKYISYARKTHSLESVFCDTVNCSSGMHLGPAKNSTTADLGIICFRAGKVGEVSKKKKIHREKSRFSI